MDEVIWMQLIQSLGFPIVVALWFMFRVEKLIKKQTAIMWKLEIAIEHLLARKKLIGKKNGTE